MNPETGGMEWTGTYRATGVIYRGEAKEEIVPSQVARLSGAFLSAR